MTSKEKSNELKPCPIKAVYERFKHMDKLFCDPLIRLVSTEDTDPYRAVMFMLWEAVKEYQTRPERELVPLDEELLYNFLLSLSGDLKFIYLYAGQSGDPARDVAKAICQKFLQPKEREIDISGIEWPKEMPRNYVSSDTYGNGYNEARDECKRSVEEWAKKKGE